MKSTQSSNEIITITFMKHLLRQFHHSLNISLLKMKKEKPKKTLEHRQQEVDNLMKQFLDLGFPLEHKGTQEFFKIVKDFEHESVSCSGIIKFTEFDRRMRYMLTTQPHIDSQIVLEYTGTKKAAPSSHGFRSHKGGNARVTGLSFQSDVPGQ